jgi:D-tyrosyl-tRNA(Tyr) deacylase
VGVGKDDGFGEYDRLAEKVFHLRVFEDEQGKMNRSLSEVGGEVLVVPQFTLFGDVQKGRRPSWDGAAPPEIAEDRVEAFAKALDARARQILAGRSVSTWRVELVKTAVTLWIDTVVSETDDRQGARPGSVPSAEGRLGRERGDRVEIVVDSVPASSRTRSRRPRPAGVEWRPPGRDRGHRGHSERRTGSERALHG